MLVHIFGATSLPCIATYCLRKTTSDFGDNFDALLTEIILRDFYVDDCLTCADTLEEAKNLVKGLSDLLSKGGFTSAKWKSDVAEVFLFDKDAMSETIIVDLNADCDNQHHVLGVQWNSTKDVFGCSVNQSEEDEVTKYTRRKILSKINSVYDPIGFVAPVILVA